MFFSWLRTRRRGRLLAQPFPAAWPAYLDSNVAPYRTLSSAEKRRLHDDLRILVAEKNWEGCGGLTMTEEIKVTIAAQAALLLLGIQHDYFPKLMSILVYPSSFLVPDRPEPDDWLVEEDEDARSGEAWYRGPVILAWDEVLDNGRDPSQGRNLVIHEFAHQLDFEDGILNGTPPLSTRASREAWRDVMTGEYERLVRESEEGRDTLLDEYGAQDPMEFFAVVSECFFTQPRPMRSRHPRLYQLLREYYQQDTAARDTD